MTAGNLQYNDIVFLITLVYIVLDIHSELDNWSTCEKPLHIWLLLSFVGIMGLRLVHLAGKANESASGRLLALIDLRQKGTSKALMYFTWLAVLPLFALWTFVGTAWMIQTQFATPNCMPSHFAWFSLLLQVYCYARLGEHVYLGVLAFRRENEVRSAEAILREVEDEDAVNRWGSVSNLHGTLLRGGMRLHRADEALGLLPSDIAALPCSHIKKDDDNQAGAEDDECAICLTDIRLGDVVRQLGACNHVFHRPCIDLWLLQQASCPLCKTKVVVT